MHLSSWHSVPHASVAPIAHANRAFLAEKIRTVVLSSKRNPYIGMGAERGLCGSCNLSICCKTRTTVTALVCIYPPFCIVISILPQQLSVYGYIPLQVENV